jgi:hypothetical protein
MEHYPLGLGRHHSFDVAVLLHWLFHVSLEARNEGAIAHAYRDVYRDALGHAYLVGYDRADRDAATNSYPVAPAVQDADVACHDHAHRYRDGYTYRDVDAHADVDVYVHSNAHRHRDANYNTDRAAHRNTYANRDVNHDADGKTHTDGAAYRNAYANRDVGNPHGHIDRHGDSNAMNLSHKESQCESYSFVETVVRS